MSEREMDWDYHREGWLAHREGGECSYPEDSQACNWWHRGWEDREREASERKDGGGV